MTFLEWFGSIRCRKCGVLVSGAGCSAQAPDCPIVETQAIRWFVLLHSDEPSEASQQCKVKEFQIWHDANLAHGKAYREVEKLWASFESYGNKPEIHAQRQKILQDLNLKH